MRRKWQTSWWLTVQVPVVTSRCLITTYSSHSLLPEEEDRVFVALQQLRWYRDGFLGGHVMNIKLFHFIEVALGAKWRCTYCMIKPQWLLQNFLFLFPSSPSSASSLFLSCSLSRRPSPGLEWNSQRCPSSTNHHTGWQKGWHTIYSVLTLSLSLQSCVSAYLPFPFRPLSFSYGNNGELSKSETLIPTHRLHVKDIFAWYNQRSNSCQRTYCACLFSPPFCVLLHWNWKY